MNSTLRFLLCAFAALTLLPLTGAAYEAIASAADGRAYPAPGVLIDVGGHRMHLNCIGDGSPTVVLDAGLGGSSVDWALVQPELANTTRTCSYDRAGMGWSDPAPGRRTPEQIASELALLLDRAHVDGPYILVAHSLAGKNARMFALRHQEDVVGMVLIDARHEYVDEHTTASEQRAFRDAVASQGGQYALARRLGVARLIGSQLAGVPEMTEHTRREMAILTTSPSAIATTSREANERAASDGVLSAAPSLGDVPLVALAAGQAMNDARWAEAQHRLSVLSAHGRLVIAQGSSHSVHWDQPGLVIATVREVIAEARSYDAP
jgi:pimeloyl-ACP methyl ester carboxylesterase